MNRRELFGELLINGVLPLVLYSALKDGMGLGEVESLVWATVIPGLAIIVGLLRKRRLDFIAMITMVTLLLGIGLALVTDDAKLLQLRESYLSAALGAMFLISAVVGRPALAWVAPRLVPEEKRAVLAQPRIQKLLAGLTWLWGWLFSAELAVKWWMVEHLSIAQVLALGPIVFFGLTAVGVGLSLLLARRIGRSVVAHSAGMDDITDS